MDNEKIFGFMEKMYSEMQNGFKELKNGQLKLENELKKTRTTLYDGYVQNAEGINRVEAKVEYIAEKVSKNEMEIKVLQATKSKLYRG